jgi:hypothetical protein
MSDHESLIKGLMLLGRSREEAEAEIKQNENRRGDEMEKSLWDEPTGTPGRR